MYFLAMTLRLRLHGVRIPLSTANGQQMHAAIFDRICTIDAPAGQRLHDMQRYKPITLALLDSTYRSATLRICLSGSDGAALSTLFITAFASNPVLRIGTVDAVVEALDMADPIWTGLATWSDFQAAPIGNTLLFDFCTPTAITKRNDRWQRFTSLYPDPRDIFGGLAKRWLAFGGPALPEQLAEYIADGGCVVSHYALRTAECRYRTYVQIGFVGNVVYTCTRNSPYIAVLNALARFGVYTGIGYHTAQGMGVTRVRIVAGRRSICIGAS